MILGLISARPGAGPARGQPGRLEVGEAGLLLGSARAHFFTFWALGQIVIFAKIAKFEKIAKI